MQSSAHPRALDWWRISFVVYAVLSLSSMAGMSIGLGLFGAGTAAYLYASWRGEGRRRLAEAFATPFSWTTIALFLASLLSLLAAFAFPVMGSQHGPELASLKKYHYYFFPPLFAAAFRYTGPSLERHAFWRAWMPFGAVLGVIAMVQFFGADLFPASWLQSSFFRSVGHSGRYHGQGLMFFHLSFASCMCFVAATGWARLVFPLPGDGTRTRGWWLLGAVLATAGVWFSYSRIAFVAVAIVILVLAFLKKPRWGFGATVLVAMVGFLAWTFSPTMQARFYDNASGTKERVRMWRSAWAMFSDRPLTGIGFSRTGEISPWYVTNVLHEPLEFSSHAHNNFLDMLAATGILGFAAYLAWWGFLLWACWRAFRLAPEEERWLPAAALTGFLTFHVNGLTQVNYWDGKSEHTLMVFAGLAIALWLRMRGRSAG